MEFIDRLGFLASLTHILRLISLLGSILGERQPKLLVGIWPSKISHLPVQKGGFFILDSNEIELFLKVKLLFKGF